MGFANYAQESYGTDNILNAAMQTNSVVTKVMSMVFSNIMTAVSVIADAAFQVVLYFTLVFMLVESNTSALDLVVQAFPTSPEIKDGIKDVLQETVNGVLLQKLECAIYQAVYTFIIFDFAGVKYVFLFCLSAAFVRIVPIVSTTVIGILAALQLFIVTGYRDQDVIIPLIKAVAVFIAYNFVEGRLAKDTFRRKVQQVNPTLLGLSIFLGMKAFGVQGVIYGPLLVSTGTIIF